VSGSGISWDICKSAPHSRQITTPAPHHSVFYRPDALPAAQPTASKHWMHKTETDMVAKLMLALGLLYLPTGAYTYIVKQCKLAYWRLLAIFCDLNLTFHLSVFLLITPTVLHANSHKVLLTVTIYAHRQWWCLSIDTGSLTLCI